jgi:hypothetical protein
LDIETETSVWRVGVAQAVVKSERGYDTLERSVLLLSDLGSIPRVCLQVCFAWNLFRIIGVTVEDGNDIRNAISREI